MFPFRVVYINLCCINTCLYLFVSRPSFLLSFPDEVEEGRGMGENGDWGGGGGGRWSGERGKMGAGEEKEAGAGKWGE